MTEWILRRVAFSLILACAILGAMMWNQANQPTADPRPLAVGSPEWVKQNCKPVAAGTLPSAVVLTPAGAVNAKLTNNPRLIHEALEQEFNGADYGHNVIGFCR